MNPLELKSSADHALRALHSIPHKHCASAIPRIWRVRDDGSATAASYLWLYCWAKTGQGSETARQVARTVFDDLFGPPFADIEGRIPHEWARQMRYRPNLPDTALLAWFHEAAQR